MFEVDRRFLLAALPGLVAATKAGAFQPRPRNLVDAPRFAENPFTLGVAAGDPDADGFVIWTRLAPEPLGDHGGMPAAPVLATWEVASDPAFRTIVRHGEVVAHPELGHAIHVEVDGLVPARPYWYRFVCGGHRSTAGRGATLPLPGARLDRLRFVVAGCQHYEEGHYSALRHAAAEEPDFVFHYGDYIYEGGDRGPEPRRMGGQMSMPFRRHVGGELRTLTDYRRRYALYKLDADLQAAHAAAPWFASFDDHEIDNNWAADRDQDGTPPELFELRRAMGFQAFYEHMPLRRASLPRRGHMQMFRKTRFGDLMQGFFLDTRQYRSDQAYGDREGPQRDDVFSPERTMLGDRQEQWLFDGLSSGGARWHLIAQQVGLLNLAYRRGDAVEPAFSMDQWSGYMHSRRRLLAHIAQHTPGNVMTVSGDAHRHFAGDLMQDEGDGRVISSELLATSISSGSDGVGQDDPFIRATLAGNPHLKAFIDRRGYMLCTVERDRWHAALRTIDTVGTPHGVMSTPLAFVSERGRPGLETA